MTFSLTNNFFAVARAVTFKDSASVTWVFNQNTNEISATSSGGGGGSGTVTSVGLADGSTSAIYTISGSPVSVSGTLTFTLKTQIANTVLAGPTTGAAAQPTFRALVVADLPTGIPNTNLANSSLTVTAGAGLTGGGTVSLGGTITLSLTSPVTAILGGTGQTGYTIGDLLYADTTTTLARLADVAAGSYLRSGGAATAPVWSTLTLPNAATTGDILIATGTNAIGRLADVAAGSYLRSGGGSTAPAYSATVLPNDSALGDLWYGSAAHIVTALAGNTTSVKQFLSQTGTSVVSAAPIWAAIAAGDLPANGANPGSSIGLAVVNGSATTWMRSDGAPALSVAIVPTWTGAHTFQSATSPPITVGGIAYTGALTLQVTNTSTVSGDVARWSLTAGTENLVGYVTNQNQSGAIVTNGPTGPQGGFRTLAAIPLVFATNNTFEGSFNGGMILGAPTGGALGVGTLNATGLSINNVAVSTAVGANPGTNIGLAVVNGSAATWMRSDGAPALSQSIVPTWTGAHTFSALLTANLGITVAGATTKVAAGTTTLGPLTFQSGTNLTTALAGVLEYDGTNFYATGETTSGRALVPVEQYFHLTAAGSGITTIANFFGTTSNISLVANAFYEIEIVCFFTMGATGSVVTWTLTNSAAPTDMAVVFEMSPVTGIVAPPGTATLLSGQIVGGTTAAQTVVTTSLSASTKQYARFRIMLKNGTGTSLKIQATETTTTTALTPNIGSYWRCKRIPSGNVGTFAA